MDYGTTFVVDGICYTVELEARGDKVPEDAFVQQEIRQKGGPYVLHWLQFLHIVLPLERLTNMPWIFTRV